MLKDLANNVNARSFFCLLIAYDFYEKYREPAKQEKVDEGKFFDRVWFEGGAACARYFEDGEKSPHSILYYDGTAYYRKEYMKG